tara:strand:- start:45 stop:161 length:117 start_codon:yes stop_codon:yes gene_type:complete
MLLPKSFAIFANKLPWVKKFAGELSLVQVNFKVKVRAH